MTAHALAIGLTSFLAGTVFGVVGYRIVLRRLHRGFGRRWILQAKGLKFAPVGWYIDGVYGAQFLGRALGIAQATEDERLEREAEEVWQGWMRRVDEAEAASRVFERNLSLDKRRLS